MYKALFELSKCRWREFRREPSAFFWVIFMPIFWMLVFGLAFNGGGNNKLSIGWLGQENEFSEALANSDQISLQIISSEQLNSSTLSKLSLIVEPLGPDHYVFRSDPNNPQTRLADMLVQNIFLSEKNLNMPQIERKEIINAKTRYIDFVVPGLLGLSIMTSSLFGIGMTLVSARRENLLKRYRATPMNPVVFFLSYVNGRFMILTVEFCVIFLAAFVLFRFEVFSSLFHLYIASLLGAAAFTSFAVFLGSRLRNVATMSGLINLLMLPMMMLGGVFFSVDNFPTWLEGLIRWLPLTNLIDLLRSIALDGTQILQHSWNVGYLLVFGLLFLILSYFCFRWND